MRTQLPLTDCTLGTVTDHISEHTLPVEVLADSGFRSGLAGVHQGIVIPSDSAFLQLSRDNDLVVLKYKNFQFFVALKYKNFKFFVTVNFLSLCNTLISNPKPLH